MNPGRPNPKPSAWDLVLSSSAANLSGYGILIALSSKVIAPDCAKTRPFTLEPVPSETDAAAIIVPLNADAVFKVAELPTCYLVSSVIPSKGPNCSRATA